MSAENSSEEKGELMESEKNELTESVESIKNQLEELEAVSNERLSQLEKEIRATVGETESKIKDLKQGEEVSVKLESEESSAISEKEKVTVTKKNIEEQKIF